MKQEYSLLKQEYDALKTELRNAQHKINELIADLATEKATYANLLKGAEQATLRNPSWAELKAFLDLDDTDSLTYDEDTFDCSGFAITLRDRAWKYGLRCAYVKVRFMEEAIGHTLNAFQTTDKGLVYVDAIENDTIAYVQVGKAYGTIVVDRVKPEYIVCPEDPAKFWGPFTRATHHNPFSYEYYDSYQQRREFLDKGIEAYNEAAENFNKGVGTYTASQLRSWGENLNALKQDLVIVNQTMGVVNKVIVYWD
ncbi:hypothetical protein ACFLV4_06395 [Chloroflexota bacterium]